MGRCGSGYLLSLFSDGHGPLERSHGGFGVPRRRGRVSPSGEGVQQGSAEGRGRHAGVAVQQGRHQVQGKLP